MVLRWRGACIRIGNQRVYKSAIANLNSATSCVSIATEVAGVCAIVHIDQARGILQFKCTVSEYDLYWKYAVNEVTLNFEGAVLE